MKKYFVKRYLESVDPKEVSESDREYILTPELLIEMYGMESMSKLREDIYQDDDSTDIFRIKKDDNGYYVVTYTCVQDILVDEEEEIYELFKFKLIQLDNNIYESAHDPAFDISHYEDCLLLLQENL